MSYIIYQTEGVILSKTNFGEADKLFYIFTEQFGLIRASANGVLNLKSESELSSARFYDVTGRMVEQVNLNGEFNRIVGGVASIMNLNHRLFSLPARSRA